MSRQGEADRQRKAGGNDRYNDGLEIGQHDDDKI